MLTMIVSRLQVDGLVTDISLVQMNEILISSNEIVY